MIGGICAGHIYTHGDSVIPLPGFLPHRLEFLADHVSGSSCGRRLPPPLPSSTSSSTRAFSTLFDISLMCRLMYPDAYPDYVVGRGLHPEQ